MRIVARPVDVIAGFIGEKRPVPYRFRFQEESGERIEVKVEKIICAEESRKAGIDALIYTCQSELNGEARIYQLKYIVGQCRWQLYKI